MEEPTLLETLETKTMIELYELAAELGIKSANKYRKAELIQKIKDIKDETSGLIYGEGILELVTEGFGFLRRKGFVTSPDDIYVSVSQAKRFGLRPGDMVRGMIRPPKENERFFSLLRVESVNGLDFNQKSRNMRDIYALD